MKSDGFRGVFFRVYGRIATSVVREEKKPASHDPPPRLHSDLLTTLDQRVLHDIIIPFVPEATSQ